MLLEIAFMDGGRADWKNDPVFHGASDFDLAAMAHGLVQFAFSGHANSDYKNGKILVSKIAAALAIEDAKDSARGM